jgi:formylglycine-generating enzyme required for sulfatase activity/tRNA A-37 threonylcarbamoyl transferase component Bud32
VSGSDLKVGTYFGDYFVEKALGSGAMGSVYLVRARSGDRYAVKVMCPSGDGDVHELRMRFLREAELAMNIRHENLVAVYDYGEDPDTGLCYILMDYVSCGSIGDRLAEGECLSVDDAVSVAVQVLRALAVAHAAGVVHRDIKPDNLLLDADGTVKLADLGVAKFTGSTTVTTTGMIIGTPAYMSPEQMIDSRNIDGRSDIYSLGIVLFTLLCGKRPNEGSSVMELMTKAIALDPIPDVRTLQPDIPAPIAEAVALMCAPDADDRPRTAEEAERLLLDAQSGVRRKVVTARRIAASARLESRRKRARRENILAGCIGTVIAVLLSTGVWFAYRGWISGGGNDVARAESEAVRQQEPDRKYEVISPVATNAAAAEAGRNQPPVSQPSAVSLSPVALDLGNDVRLDLLPCPPGVFEMGHVHGEGAFKKHRVEISRPFLLSKFPVTRRQWNRLMPEKEMNRLMTELGGLDAPVSDVTPEEMAAFCGEMNNRCKSHLKPGYIFRLPTEAEWEYACRAPGAENGIYAVPVMESDESYGGIAVQHSEKVRQLDMLEITCYKDDGEIPGVKVGMKAPNAWGFYDMLGNVYQATADRLPFRHNDRAHVTVNYIDGKDPVLRMNGSSYSLVVRGCGLSRYVGWGVEKKTLSCGRHVPVVGFRIALAPDLGGR